MSADIAKMYRDGTNQWHDDRNVEIGRLEDRVVETAEAWFKARTTPMTDETWAAISDDCESKEELLYQATRALIAAREKE